MIVVIRGAYCSYCDGVREAYFSYYDSGDRELTVVTEIVVIRGDYCSYCDSGDRGTYFSY